MISEATAEKIRQLKAMRCTQAAIAATLEVSRATVGRVLRGRWRPRPFRQRQVRQFLQLWEKALPLCDRLSPGYCRACKEPVYLPCVGCLARLLAQTGAKVSVRALRRTCNCGGNFRGRPPGLRK
jgi:hypothetical protein